MPVVKNGDIDCICYYKSMDTTMLAPLLHRAEDANKYDFGHVLIVGGSPAMVGAPLMAGEAALRIGAGVVTVASDEETIARAAGKVEELITHSLPAAYDLQSRQQLLQYIQDHHVSVLAIGPGLAEPAFAYVRELLPLINVPVVLDAGGLTAFQEHMPLLEDFAGRQKLIITPHTGEFSQLTGEDYESHAEAGAAAKELAKKTGVTIVLKGHRTLVAQPSGKAFINLTGNPGMATAGSGDILTGMIAGLVGQQLPLHDPVEIAVYVHGLAGDLAAEDQTEPGMIATDIIQYIPAALHKIAATEA